MKTLFGDPICYIKQGRCDYGGDGDLAAHYTYYLLDDLKVESGLRIQLTAEQAEHFAHLNNLTMTYGD